MHRVGQYAANGFTQAARQVGLPTVLKRLGAGDGDALGIGVHDQDAMALSECWGNQTRDLGQVELHGVDLHVGLADLVRKPLAEAVQIKALAWLLAILQATGGDLFQRMAGGLGGGVPKHLQGVVGVQVLVGEQGFEHAPEVECRIVLGMHGGVRA